MIRLATARMAEHPKGIAVLIDTRFVFGVVVSCSNTNTSGGRGRCRAERSLPACGVSAHQDVRPPVAAGRTEVGATAHPEVRPPAERGSPSRNAEPRSEGQPESALLAGMEPPQTDLPFANPLNQRQVVQRWLAGHRTGVRVEHQPQIAGQQVRPCQDRTPMFRPLRRRSNPVTSDSLPNPFTIKV